MLSEIVFPRSYKRKKGEMLGFVVLLALLSIQVSRARPLLSEGRGIMYGYHCFSCISFFW